MTIIHKPPASFSNEWQRVTAVDPALLVSPLQARKMRNPGADGRRATPMLSVQARRLSRTVGLDIRAARSKSSCSQKRNTFHPAVPNAGPYPFRTISPRQP